MWEIIDSATDTRASEIPGVGCIVGTPGFGMCFVPGTRLYPLSAAISGATHVITREDRNSPPVRPNVSAAAIRARQPADPDPGAAQYLSQVALDESDY